MKAYICDNCSQVIDEIGHDDRFISPTPGIKIAFPDGEGRLSCKASCMMVILGKWEAERIDKEKEESPKDD